MLHITLSWKAKHLMTLRPRTNIQPSFSPTAILALLSLLSSVISLETRRLSKQLWTSAGFQLPVDSCCQERPLRRERQCLKPRRWGAAVGAVSSRSNWRCPVQTIRICRWDTALLFKCTTKYFFHGEFNQGLEGVSRDPIKQKYRQIPKISPAAYIFRRAFLRGLFLEGLTFGRAYLRREICVSQSIRLAL